MFDHTADVGIEARGATLEECFANAALATFSVMTDLSSVQPLLRQNVTVDGADLEDVLVGWLNELLYISTVEQVLFSRFDVSRVTPTSLEAVALGERMDPARHRLLTEIKAATYHRVKVEHNDEWRAHVILDL
ncbi:MAG: archease [Chloroflexota bacterium]|nr:MAG: archease [Chloroflexota bacterium]